MNERAGKITVIEENNLILSNIPHIYENPQLVVNTETDRSFLRRSNQQYEIIILSLVDTYHPVGSGAYSLAENYSYTQEAFQDTLDRLSPDGLFVVTRWLQLPPSEWLRTFILAASALENRGDEPWQQIVAIRSFNTGVLFIKNSPFTDEELSAVRAFARDQAFDLVFLPDIQPEEVNQFSILKEPIYYRAFTNFLSAESKEDWLTNYPYDVSPPTDDHPFFGHYFKSSQTDQIIAELGKTWQPFGGAGYLVVLILLGLALVVSACLIFLPLFIASRTTSKLKLPSLSRGNVLAPIAYFGLIGLGYLFVEIPLFQNMILFLGQPTYALTIVLFSILLFSGVGSHLSHNFNHRKAMIGLVGLVFLVLLLLPTVVKISLGLPFVLKVLITVVVLVPLGLLMGIPFPSGLKIIERTSAELIPWVWGINGTASVISSILAMLLALSFGFKVVLVTGALCYAGACLLIQRLRLLG
jgi:predicted membrane-bound spermidine synthase